MSPPAGTPKKYVTCFPGARDGYHLPYALYKNNRLGLFITDFYNKAPLNKFPSARLKASLKKRSLANDLLPHDLVDVHPDIALKRKLLGMIMHASKASVIEDDMYARLAVEASKKLKAGLFLYEFQAETAFRESLGHNAARHVFYFHPHPSFEHPMLLADTQKYPGFRDEVLANTRQSFGERFRDHTKTAWKNADHIFVASTFTKRSICAAGANESNITVAPYGVTLDEPYREADLSGVPYFLFVGSGAHRKGLHHLLEAWSKSGLGSKGKLVVVSRVADSFNARLLETTPGVEWKRGVSRSELIDLYSRASLFVLPSMSEGFGHVYLEALHFGCPVLGTDHSLLADITGNDDVVFKVEPGNVDELRAKLIALWQQQPGLDIALRRRASMISSAFTWERFHGIIERTLTKFD